MLSTNTLLRDGRYRIGHAITSGESGAVFTADDQRTKQKVAVIVSAVSVADANDARIESLVRLQHDGLVRIADNFHENGRAYEVTESIRELEIFTETEAAATETETARIFERLRSILDALKSLRAEFPQLKFIEIMPENVIETADGKFKLLFIEMPGILFARNPPDSPYLPFERVWPDLDLISQRAFYREFDDAALEVLESPPDARSDIYSLGAVFYKLLTGHSPLTAFERSFEMLDTNKDALRPPSSLNPAVNAEQSQFVMRMLELKRENRFASFDDAVSHLPGAGSKSSIHLSQQPAAKTDDLDLLEIPVEPQSGRVEVATNGHSVDVPVLDELVALSSMEVTPESAKYSEDLNSFVDQFYADDRLQERLDEHASAKNVFVFEETESSNAAPVAEKNAAATVFSPESEQTVENAGFMKMIGLAVGGIVIVAVGGFALLRTTSTDEPAKPESQTTFQAPVSGVSESQPQPAQPEPAIEPIDQSLNTQPVPPQVGEKQTETRPAAARVRSQTAELKQKPAETKPSAKTEAKPKKKITVDDLLN